MQPETKLKQQELFQAPGSSLEPSHPQTNRVCGRCGEKRDDIKQLGHSAAIDEISSMCSHTPSYLKMLLQEDAVLEVNLDQR